jgi:hypothetical protein
LAGQANQVSNHQEGSRHAQDDLELGGGNGPADRPSDIGPTAKAAVPVLRRALQSDRKSFRYAAVEALGGIRAAAKEAAPDLAAIMKGNDAPHLKYKAAQAIVRVVGPVEEMVPFLIEKLKDAEVYSRYEAIQLLGLIGLSLAGHPRFEANAQGSIGLATERRHERAQANREAVVKATKARESSDSRAW